MAKAMWKDRILAESNQTIMVEGNQYFPPDSINKAFFKPSSHSSICPWKGAASYYNIVVNGEVNQNAAWYYPDPKEAAEEITGHIAFWKGIKVES